MRKYKEFGHLCPNRKRDKTDDNSVTDELLMLKPKPNTFRYVNFAWAPPRRDVVM